jgi:hypothetical protein
MLGCGKEEGGYSEYLCPACGKDLRRIGFACKSCFCLSCAKGYTDDFVAQVSRVLQPGVKYRHMILTVPEQLRITFYRNRHEGELLSAFMRYGYECLEGGSEQGGEAAGEDRSEVSFWTFAQVLAEGKGGTAGDRLEEAGVQSE